VYPVSIRKIVTGFDRKKVERQRGMRGDKERYWKQIDLNKEMDWTLLHYPVSRMTQNG
jgi:hypothetical protein